ncbi:hypothetical protein HDU76_013934 [Blyttiomyces sp. JEL0837]|nr:hypothetical protein HDU76_013934 [Blyttiomyces sp. JEL0837]
MKDINSSNEPTLPLGTIPNANRLLVGLWQLSSPAWGSAPRSEILAAMKRNYDAGFRTFDGDAELIFASFRQSLPDPTTVHGFTKWCPKPGPMTRPIVEAAIRQRLQRMGTTQVDVLQFHWWDYSDKRYIDALLVMKQLKEEGLIKNIALTNFDTVRLKEILDAGVPVVSNQVQYSLIDRRPEIKMKELCLQHNIKLLSYGTFCGGFLADKYLNAPEPQIYTRTSTASSFTPSQRKYYDMIEAFGGWPLFQELLQVLKKVGDKHSGVSIANVATRYILEKPWVGGVIVGSRLGVSDHVQDNLKVFGFSLDEEDYGLIEGVLKKSDKEELFKMIGDCGDEYRR